MAKVKLEPRLYTLLFCIAVFFLASVGLAVLYYGMLPPSFLFILGYVMAWALLFGFAVDFFGGKGKLSGKKVLVLTFVVMLISTLFTHSIWTITTPNWSFSVSTDKSTYRLGELVTITASLRNMGFIPHSFKSGIGDPVLISIEYWGGPQLWFSRFHESVTEFSIEPSDSLVSNFVWNQTKNTRLWRGEEIEPGTYYIRALIPRAGSGQPIGFDNLFWAWTSINITSP